MQLSFFIAKRYLVSKKSHNLINVISLITVIGLTIGAAALIVVLSVFNGFESVIKSMYNVIDADFNFGKIDEEKIKKILVEEHDFSEDRVNKQLDKLRNAEEKAKQKGLDKWF